MAAGSSSINIASDQNKRQNEMKQQTRNQGKQVMDSTIHRPGKVKTCHQCHQHRSFATACKNQRKKKPCTLHYCHRCLLNRYGEKAEEAEASEIWSCPKCRDICNCSICREKRGLLPTGNLSRKAKTAGYSSVSELLHAKGPENFGLVKNANDTGAPLKKRPASKTEFATPGKRGKEIVVFKGTVLDVHPLTAIPLQQSTMNELNYPSEDMMEEVDEAAEDVNTEYDISSKIAIPGPTYNTNANGEGFVDVDSEFDHHSEFDENFEFTRKIGIAEKHAAGKIGNSQLEPPPPPPVQQAPVESSAPVLEAGWLEFAAEMREGQGKLSKKMDGILEELAFIREMVVGPRPRVPIDVSRTVGRTSADGSPQKLVPSPTDAQQDNVNAQPQVTDAVDENEDHNDEKAP